ncbi:hypothetical protein K9M79_07200 [Candidatus Woesearchaeota archaeon]|nr:hypothetical protein [Candidatus Woesearchaeota archaeon]
MQIDDKDVIKISLILAIISLTTLFFTGRVFSDQGPDIIMINGTVTEADRYSFEMESTMKISVLVYEPLNLSVGERVVVKGRKENEKIIAEIVDLG